MRGKLILYHWGFFPFSADFSATTDDFVNVIYSFCDYIKMCFLNF